MGNSEDSSLNKTLLEVWEELNLLATTAPPGVLGPPSLVTYEISSLEQRLAEVNASRDPVKLEGCLTDARKLLYRYKAASTTQD